MQEMPVWFLRQEDPLEKGKLPTPVFLGFPGGTDGGKESACNAGDLGLIPELGWSPGERNGNPLQHSCLENSMDRAAWQVTVHGVAKSQTWLSGFHFEQVYSTVKGHPEVLKKHPPGASDQCLLCEASRPCPGLPVSSQGPSGILWTHWCPWCRSVQKLGRDGDNSKSCYKHLLLPFIFGFFPTILINLMLSTIVWGTLGFPSGSDGNESACSVGNMSSIPGSGLISWSREWLPTPVLLPGECHGQRSLVGYSPRDCKESDTTERQTAMTLMKSTGFSFPLWGTKLGSKTLKSLLKLLKESNTNLLTAVCSFWCTHPHHNYVKMTAGHSLLTSPSLFTAK